MNFLATVPPCHHRNGVESSRRWLLARYVVVLIPVPIELSKTRML